MVYHLLYPLHTQFSVFNVIQYITFRTAAAGLTAFVISLMLGPWTIRTLRGFQIGQIVRDELATHQSKAGTPTMGGVLIIAAAIVPTLPLGRSHERLCLGGDALDAGVRPGWLCG